MWSQGRVAHIELGRLHAKALQQALASFCRRRQNLPPATLRNPKPRVPARNTRSIKKHGDYILPGV
ncbi:MAG: hypothetical protein FRX49_06830 [Trebouxia sp. A1-2]|nr:MAG: hypothetical protein FRX49_06830 [Trebouxia sp. A1-2]